MDPSGGAVELMMGATFKGPPPDISDDKSVPFDVLKSLSLDVFTDHDTGKPSLPPIVSFQIDMWKSTQPRQSGGASSWTDVVERWKAPDWAAPTALFPEGDKTDPEPVDVVGLAMSIWSDVMDWGLGGGAPDPTRNQLKNDLYFKEDASVPMVWSDFESLYMAAPLVGVSP